MEKTLLIFGIAIFILGVSRNIFFTFFKIKLFLAYEGSYKIFGIASTLAGLGGAGATILYGKMVDRFGGVKIFAVGSLVYMSFYFILAFSRNPIILTIPWIVPVGSLISIPAVSLTAELSEEKARGRAQGVVSGAQRIAGIGTVIGGLVADYIGALEDIQQLNLIFLGLTPFPLLSVIITLILLKVEKK
ncbi:MAG: MFS transporter [Candidatus Korarchaeota archaeon]|nr:MFS transporter [Candidatus Korarchaeota archaeon]NIU85435.1 MFS transporter [Candidatus Thorarchaeota archaeon]NIW15545.1 MFS transporter [Candidatus Thorarchaeota archaeon]NIW53487.1 MFS transporter [Candidatus Korarchaeota archaeon]